MICRECNKNEAVIKVEPTRHFMSPLSINHDYSRFKKINPKLEKYYEWYCSKECQKKCQDKTYAYLAELDRNASDGECFEHEGWDKKMRVGRCKITGEKVRVEPLQRGENSGQPMACYEHFVLKKKYQDALDR